MSARGPRTKRSLLAFGALAVLFASSLLAQPLTLQLRWEATQATLDWVAQTGKTYFVESSASPTGPWTPTTSLVATNNLGSWRDVTVGGVPQRFYRIREDADLSATNALLAADSLGQRILDSWAAISADCVGAVSLASQLQGNVQLITTGTLTETASGPSYSPTPTDRLVLRYTNGVVTTYTITAMQGNFAGGVSGFLQSSHDFRFRVVSGDTLDMEFVSILNGCNATGTARGKFQEAGIGYNADLSVTGQYCGNTGGGYSDFTDDHTLTGTITSPGFALVVNQRRHYYSISSAQSFASTAQDWLNQKLTLGNDVYQWSNVTKKRSFSDLESSKTHPVHFDPAQNPLEWGATGQVLKNDLPFGIYQYHYNPSSFHLRFLLTLPTGTLELERYTLL
jgi:hypothetical protein